MIKRATVNTWADYFEKHEGVWISGNTIRQRLKKAEKIGEDGRTKLRQLFKGAYYSEQDVREACADLLNPMPQADEKGFFGLGGIRYGTSFAWSCELGISERSTKRCLCDASVASMEGKDSGGRIQDFYPEPAVRAAAADLLLVLPQANKSGFFIQNGIRHGTAFAWSRELGVYRTTITSRLRSASIKSTKGRMERGQVHDFYPEPAVHEFCADLLKPLPQADKSGFFFLDGVRHGTKKAWAREMGFSYSAIASHLRSATVITVKGKDSSGQLQEFFPEPAIRDLCKDLIEKRNNPKSP